MALNFNGGWGTWQGTREYERHTLKAPMRHDRPQHSLQRHYLATALLQELEGTHSNPVGRLGGHRNRHPGQRKHVSGLTTVEISWDQGFRNRLSPDRVGDGLSLENERTVDRWFDTSAFVAPIMDSRSGPPAERARNRSQGNSAPYPSERRRPRGRFGPGPAQAVRFRRRIDPSTSGSTSSTPSTTPCSGFPTETSHSGSAMKRIRRSHRPPGSQ